MINKKLPDVQSEKINGSKIKKVGIREMYSEVEFNKKIIPANFSIYISLIESKGIHMSRLPQTILEMSPIKINKDFIKNVLDELEKRSGDFSSDYYVKNNFDYLKYIESPITKIKHPIRIPIKVRAEKKNNHYKFYLEIKVQYTSLCPCSKEISKYSAHNQRSEATINVELNNSDYFEIIEKIISIVNNESSCRIFGILKREDEKYVTETAYENPKFVEDVGRGINIQLQQLLDKDIKDYSIVINHFESIHSHNAVAILNAGRELK